MLKIKALLFVRTQTIPIPKIGKVHVPVYSTLNFVRNQTLAKVQEYESVSKKRLQECTLRAPTTVRERNEFKTQSHSCFKRKFKTHSNQKSQSLPTVAIRGRTK